MDFEPQNFRDQLEDIASFSRQHVLKPIEVEFKLEQILTEEHRPPQIYSVRFCDTIPAFFSYFASVGANAASVYEIRPNNAVEIVLAFLDEDIDEILYSCAWGATVDGIPLLVHITDGHLNHLGCELIKFCL
jgi:hypothetical protein